MEEEILQEDIRIIWKDCFTYSKGVLQEETKSKAKEKVQEDFLSKKVII